VPAVVPAAMSTDAMSLAPFADIEQAVDADVIRLLANAVATIGNVDVPVIFDEPFSMPFDGEVDASTPSCTGAVEALRALQRGARLVIGDRTFQVMTSGPDGGGFWRLELGGV